MTNDSAVQIEERVRKLADQVVDLGVFCEDMFKNALSLIFSQEWSGAYPLFDTQPDVNPKRLEQEAYLLLQHPLLTMDAHRLVLMYQYAARDLALIHSDINEIARLSRSMLSDHQQYMNQLGPDFHSAFYALVNSAYVQIRYCVIALSNNSSETAANVIRQDNLLDSAYLHAHGQLQTIMKENHRNIAYFGQLDLIISDIETLGNRTSHICQRILGFVDGSFSSGTLASGIY